MWDLIVSLPDHCLSFYFLYLPKVPFGHLHFLNFLHNKKKKKTTTKSVAHADSHR